MADSFRTETDPAAQEWAINDRVVQLRIWGTAIAHPLPEAGEGPVLGASEACSIRIDDPSGQVSRTHARIVRTKSGWGVRDLESKNGIHLDGAQRSEGPLEPGTELRLGGVVLIAESAQLIALRGFLARLLGWGDTHRQDVDRALRSVRLAATHRAPLVLSGHGELVTIALSLHAHVRGRDKPFILCDRRRRRADADVRSVTNFRDARNALRAAIGGSLCLLRRRMPHDASAVLAETRGSRPRAQVIMCMSDDEQSPVEPFLADPIVIPPLAKRDNELDRIITEYAADAIKELGSPRSVFTDEDREWVRTHSTSSLREIEKGTRRLVALRAVRTMSGAAARLGMAAISLSRWLARRDLVDEFRLRGPKRVAPPHRRD
jgi:hypothetical protein